MIKTPHKKGCFEYVTKLFDGEGSSFGDLGMFEYPFIAVTHKFTLIQKSSIC